MADAENFGWSIYEREAARMSAPKPGRSYVNSGKQPADRAEDGIEQEVQSNKAKKEKPDHCPPCDENDVMELRRDFVLISDKAQMYDQI
jgi:hypothetical protein